MTDAELDAALEKALLREELKKSLAEDDEKAQRGNKAVKEVAETGPGFIGQSLKAAGQGLMKVPAAAAQLISLPASLFADDPKKLPGNKTAAAFTKLAEEALPLDFKNMTEAEKSWFQGLSDTGTAVGFAGPAALAKAPLATLGSAAMGTLGSNLGREAGKKFDFPGAETIGALLGGLGLGGGTAFTLGPKLNAAKDDLHQATKGLTKEDFAEALTRAENFRKGGAKTDTLPDAFGPNSSIMALGQKVRNSELGNPLQARTAGREQDLTQLGEEYLSRIGPKVEPANVANDLADAANSTLRTSEKLRSTGIANRFMTEPPAKPVEVFKLYREMAARAKDPKTPEDIAGPYAEVAKKLLNQDGSPITDPQTLSFQIKLLKALDKNPRKAASGADIGAGYLKDAIAYAEQQLGDILPGYRGAMDDFRDFTQKHLRGMNEGLLGRVADTNPNLPRPTPAGRLGPMTSPEYGEDTVQGIARMLSDKGMTGGPIVAPTDIARASGQLQLAKNPTDPGAVLGNGAEERIAKLLSLGGKNVDDTLAPVRAARDLKPLTTPGMNEVPRMAPIQAAIRLLRTMDMTVTRAQQKAYAEELGGILAQPAGKESLAELQKLAMFDPEIRKKLTLLMPAITSGVTAKKE